ncbi:MAG: PA2778 family cysteine peptidase [Burkholderiales bacterium]
MILRFKNTRLIAGIFILSLCGCAAAPQTHSLLQSGLNQLPPQVELADVPFFAQEAFQCGPASLASALNAAGFTATPESLKPMLYLPGRNGSLQVEMLAAARRHDALAYTLAPKLYDVLLEVSSGTPVVVLQNLALSWHPKWHYAIVIGYDIKRGEIILRSGLDHRQVLPMRTFEYTWARSSYWAMVVLPLGKMPVTAKATEFLSAVSVLEKSSDPASTIDAYRAALIRWPGNLIAQIGLGNNAYRMGDLIHAEAVFRQATKDHPESAAAANNLAQTLADQGRYAEALKMAHQAVSLGGELQQTAQETLSAIEQKISK